MRESPITTLERWTDSGAGWRLVTLTPDLAIVDLLTCTGEPVDRLESRDREFIDWLEGQEP
ncbi:MAG TPA: hypothetical protein VGF25_08115 [Thermoleophilaceae bacterium]|jgi:hypothetical protein